MTTTLPLAKLVSNRQIRPIRVSRHMAQRLVGPEAERVRWIDTNMPFGWMAMMSLPADLRAMARIPAMP